MNEKQGLKAHIKNLEETITEMGYVIEDQQKQICDLLVLKDRNARDIKVYNQCIDSMIQGGNPCEWCEERRLGECEHPECDGKGCETWWRKDLDEVEKAEEAAEAAAEDKAENEIQIEGANT